MGINNQGDVVSVFHGNPDFCVLYAAGSENQLPIYGNPDNCKPYAINDNRQIAGTFIHSGVTHGFVWTTTGINPISGQYTELLAANGNFNDKTAAYGIDPNGNVVGSMWVGGFEHAAAWNLRCKRVACFYVATDLGAFDCSGCSSRAFGTNGSEVVGESRFPGGEVHAVLWQNNVMFDISPVNGGTSSANAVNLNSDAVGFVDSDTALWHNQTPTRLIVSQHIVATAISSDGWIVGMISPLIWGDRSYLVSPCGPQNLATMLDKSGTGWRILAVRGINSQHRIVGTAFRSTSNPPDSQGYVHAIVLVPNGANPCSS
jgi:probable HAF family extracellular repeat protein